MSAPTARKPHRDWAGYVSERRNPLSGGHNVLVRAADAKLDTDGGAWVTICDKHGSCCNHETLAIARDQLNGADWCEECMAIAQKLKNVKRVRFVSHYWRITRGGHGIGLQWREIQDADTGEVVKRYGRGGMGHLRTYAEKQGWTLVRPDEK